MTTGRAARYKYMGQHPHGVQPYGELLINGGSHVRTGAADILYC